MTTAGVVALIAGREVRTKALSRTFVLTTLTIVAAIVLGSGLATWLASPEAEKVAVVADSRELGSTLRALAAAGDTEVELVEAADRAEAERLVADGDVDLALLPGSTVLVESEVPSSLSPLISAMVQQQALSSEVVALGGDPAAVGSALAEAVPVVERLDGEERDGAQVFAGLAAGILIFVAVMSTGQMVAQGVVEEKSSRVVELLLATVRPWQLLTGKVLGIGVVGLIQVVCVLAASVVSALAFDLFDASSLDLGATALWTLVWFVLGYATYAIVLAGLAALVSRQEDVAQVISPVMVVMMIPYFLAVTVVPWDPGNVVVRVLSQVPFCAPLMMPVRVAIGGVEAWEVALSLGLSVAALPVLIWLAGRLYARGVLRTGARVGLLAALRS